MSKHNVTYLQKTYSIPSWKPDTPFHEPPDKQMIQDFYMSMTSVVLDKIHFPDMLDDTDEDSHVNCHMVHIPQSQELVLKQKLLQI